MASLVEPIAVMPMRGQQANHCSPVELIAVGAKTMPNVNSSPVALIADTFTADRVTLQPSPNSCVVTLPDMASPVELITDVPKLGEELAAQ